MTWDAAHKFEGLCVVPKYILASDHIFTEKPADRNWCNSFTSLFIFIRWMNEWLNDWMHHAFGAFYCLYLLIQRHAQNKIFGASNNWFRSVAGGSGCCRRRCYVLGECVFLLCYPKKNRKRDRTRVLFFELQLRQCRAAPFSLWFEFQVNGCKLLYRIEKCWRSIRVLKCLKCIRSEIEQSYKIS